MCNHPTNSSQVVSQELIEFLTLRYTIVKFHRMGCMPQCLSYAVKSILVPLIDQVTMPSNDPYPSVLLTHFSSNTTYEA